jgi:hypothetical protein
MSPFTQARNKPALDALEMNAPDRAALRLTQFSHGGGCGCKIASTVLQEIPGKKLPGFVPQELLVGVGDGSLIPHIAVQRPNHERSRARC